MPQTKTAGARPPFDGLPPVLVALNPEPEDQDRDMLVYLRDNVRMLLGKLTDITVDQIKMYTELIAVRRKWVEEEMEVEQMLESAPSAPLGIEVDDYDLSTITQVQRNFRREKFEELLRTLDNARTRLEDRFWEQMWSQNPSS